jgi:thiol-disulfide isomerase/thioredoxin/protocatechuate 3,4-dioxygenase beta subunit
MAVGFSSSLHAEATATPFSKSPVDRQIHRAAAHLRSAGVLAVLLALLGGSVDALPNIEEPPTRPDSSAKAKNTEQPETPDADKQPSTPRHVVVKGQVTDAIGAGQKDVAVTVYRKNPDGSRGEKIAEATTDAMGDFTVTTAEPVKGDVLVAFSKPQFADVVHEVRLDESDKPPFLGEVMYGNLSLEGRVLSATNQRPIAGAKVVFQNVALERETQADDEGRFAIRELSPGDGELQVTAARFGRERVTIKLPVSEETLVLLKPERIVHLTVVDDLGETIRGVTIESLDAPRDDFRTVVTGDDGNVDLPGLHFDAHSLVLRLSHEGHVSTDGPGERLTLPLLENESRHRLVMQRAGTITGRVTDGKSGEPVHGARVIAGDTYSDYVPRAWTDTSGKFDLSGVKPATATVTVHSAGHAPELKTVEVKAGESASIDLKLTEPATLRGIVKNQTGEPIASAEVAATRWRDRRTLGLRAMTDREGRFALEDAPHDEFEIAVFAAGASPFTQKVKAGAGEPLAITLRAGDPARTAGAQTHLKPGDDVPTVNLKTLEGNAVVLAALRGKTVLVVFWATWCGPCIGEAPNLIAVYEKFRGRKDFVMIGVSRDFEEVALRDFLKANPKVAWPQAVGDDGGVPAAVEAFGVWGIPSIFVVGSDGKIAAAEIRGEEIMKEVERVLKSRPPG